MVKKFSIFKVLFLLSLIITAISCKYDLVPEPSGNGGSGSINLSDKIYPPVTVTASQGKYRTCELNWSAVSNAVQYLIFAADSPYDDFIQIGETAGEETVFNVENENTGIYKYFMIKSVNHNGTVSKGSKITCSSTLDVPIITSIVPNPEGTSVDISWWMGNCSEETYINDVQYKIITYNSTKTKIMESETISGTVSTYKITNLEPRTEYYFQVQASLKDSDQKPESSDITNIETAHKVLPGAPESVEISQGTDPNNVLISWKLPEPVDYCDKKTMIYTTHPIYFTLQRKVEGEPDEAYKTLVNYIGCVKSTGLLFNCSTNTSNSSLLKVEKDDSGITNEKYPKYTSLSKLTYTDKTTVKGVKYTYKIQSYTDDVGTEPITSKEFSFKEDNGWRTAAPNFTANSEMTKEENFITSINVAFGFSFENFEKDYLYMITYQRTAFGTDNPQVDEEKIYATSKDKSFADYIFNNLENKELHGYYLYKLYILPSDADTKTIPSSYIDVVTAANMISVTDDASQIPEIKNFKVQSGYKSKFVLTWDAIEGATYTVKWIPYVDGQSLPMESKTLDSGDYTVSGNTVTFNHEAVSGDRRLYTLNVSKNGIPDSEVYQEISETLGTALPEMEKPEYKSIKVTWPSVQKANTDYVIKAEYEDKKSVLNDSTTITEENGIVTLLINEPEGFDNITKSGLPIKLTITAKNTETADSTTAEINVRTLGPALINTTAETNAIQESKLQVSWNKIPGATGYIIYRTKYAYNNTYTNWVFDKADSYFYDASVDEDAALGKIQTNGSDVSSSRAKISLLNGVYTLNDYDCPQSDSTNGYEARQAQIKWGAPYGYVVIPVNGSSKDFEFGSDSEYLNICGGEAGFTYKNKFADQKTATKGFGFNIAAEKSQSLTTQVVTWAPPYFSKLGKKFTPELYRRSVDGNEKGRWTKINTSSASGATKVTYSPDAEDKENTFEYFITYSNQLPTDSIMNYLENTLEDNPIYDYSGVAQEQKNKGYLLCTPFTAGFGGENCTPADDTYYSEVVDWNNLWDYEKRSIGPKSAKVYVFNPDRPVWTELFTLNGDLSYNEANPNATNISVNKATDSKVFVSPKNFTGDTVGKTKMGLTEGPLVVLRDYLHYYKIVFNEDENLSIGGDLSISAYRNIKPAELACCVNYIIADCIYKCGIPNSTLGNVITKTVSGANNTSFKLKTDVNGALDYYDKLEWGFNNTAYQHIFNNGHSSLETANDDRAFISGFSLKAGTSSMEASSDEGVIYRLPALSITVTHKNGLASYTGTVSVSVGENDGKNKTSWTLINTVDSKTVIDVNNETDFLKVFPYDFGTKHSSSDYTANTNLKTYQNPWWN